MILSFFGDPQVLGMEVDAQSRCLHYRSDLDIVAIRFPCCGEFYSCHACHEELADHSAETWMEGSQDELAVFCGACRTVMSIADYLACQDVCPVCGEKFNPACKLHRRLYFSF